MDINEIVNKFKLPNKTIALGPSSLESLAKVERWPNEAEMVAIPDNLLRLLNRIREGSVEHINFLIRIIRYFRVRPLYSRHQKIEDDIPLVKRIVDVVFELQGSNRLLVISEEIIDPKIKEALKKLYPGRAFEISLSPKKNFLREYLATIYSWSKHTGGVILERGRRVFSDMGHHIATLQLPDKLDHYVDLKSRYVGRIFGFRGGKTAKFFVGLTVSVAGLSSPIASLAGVVIAFADP